MILSVFMKSKENVSRAAANASGIAARNILIATVAGGPKIVKYNELTCESMVKEWERCQCRQRTELKYILQRYMPR